MICLASGCKINLGLRILGIRSDGYHELESIFYPLKTPCDHLFIYPADRFGLHLSHSSPHESIADNILVKTYTLFSSLTGFKPALKVHLKKRVPIGAGLGGGSANAGIFLNWLNRICPTPVSKATLCEIAAQLGSDVPFFLHMVPSFISGKGEVIKAVKFYGKGLFILLVYPNLSLSTAKIFHKWDKLNNEIDLTNFSSRDNDFNSILDIRKNLDLNNDLEKAAYKLYPKLSVFKEWFIKNGAIRAAMSGSGSAHYGIFSRLDIAQKAAQKLRTANLIAYLLPMQNFGA